MDIFLLWDHFLNYLRTEDKQYYRVFTFNVFPVSFSENVLNILVSISPDRPYLARWIENIYKKKMEEVLSHLSKTPIRIKIQVKILKSDGNGPAEAAEAAPVPASPAADAPFPENAGEDSVLYNEVAPLPEEETPAEEILPQEDAPFPDEEVSPPDFSGLTAKSASDVDLPDINDASTYEDDAPLHATSLFDQPGTPRENDRSSDVDEACTFETFVHGNCNELAYQAALSMARSATNPEQADPKMNPLFIYGPSGLGKTHLLKAICNYVRKNRPNLKIRSVTSESFTNELINAIQNHTMPNFRQKYRTLDFLLIDDVQFFGSRESTKMEIFNTFNELFDKKSKIILTSDRTPADIEKLEDRLQSRFSSGLVAPILPPDYEICTIILQKQAEKRNINLPKDVIEYMAVHINTNVRELEGAFNKVVSYAHIMKKPFTLAVAKEALKDQIPIDDGPTLTVDIIIDEVCRYFGVRKDKLLGNGRPQKIVIPRQIAMYLCRTELNESYPTLRDAFHRKDHSTVLYACERVEKDLATNPQTKASVEAIRRKLRER